MTTHQWTRYLTTTEHSTDGTFVHTEHVLVLPCGLRIFPSVYPVTDTLQFSVDHEGINRYATALPELITAVQDCDPAYYLYPSHLHVMLNKMPRFDVDRSRYVRIYVDESEETR